MLITKYQGKNWEGCRLRVVVLNKKQSHYRSQSLFKSVQTTGSAVAYTRGRCKILLRKVNVSRTEPFKMEERFERIK